MIGSDVVVTILDITNDRVRNGIAAPREVLILREELIAPRDASPPSAPPMR